MHSLFEEKGIAIGSPYEKDYTKPQMPEKGDYGDNNTPEIDMPKESNATNVIPDELPKRDGSGGY